MSVTTYFQSNQAMTMVPTSESVPAREGVIKFGLDFARTRYISAPMIANVNAWRQICYRLGMIGQAEHRYNGYGFGNISVRH